LTAARLTSVPALIMSIANAGRSFFKAMTNAVSPMRLRALTDAPSASDLATAA
jgi:hypothetical protein